MRPGSLPTTDALVTTKAVSPIEVATLASSLAHDVDLRNHKDVLAYVEFKDVTTVLSDLGRSNWASVTHAPWFAVSTLSDGKTKFPVADPEFIVHRGLAFMRFSGGVRNTEGHQRLIAAHLYASPGTRHAFCRYVLVIEPDVPQYMTELGVKLPGFAGTWSDTIFHPPHAGTKTFSWRMEHGPKNNLAVRDYLYDRQSGAGYGNIRDYGCKFEVGIPVVIEQELDIDANHGRVWINDVLVGERTVVADVDIEELFLNVYHGGLGYATQPIHYRIAAACIARHRIGVPPELVGTLSQNLVAPAHGMEPRLPPTPTWRRQP
jgi:hypothetical protein